MKKQTKKLLSFILAAVICLTALVICALASDTAPALEINGANVSFESTVHLWYSVGYKNIDNPNEINLLIWRESSVENIKNCTLGTEDASLTPTGDVNDGKVVGKTFDYGELAAAEMTENVYARAYINVDGKAVYSPVVKYSILQYSLNKLGITGTKTENTELYDAIEALLEYGAASQKLFDTNLDRLATDSYVKIKLNGAAFADGSASSLLKLGEDVTLYAEPTSKLPYVIWTDSTGRRVGNGETLEINATSNETYTATLTDSPVYQNKDLKLWYDEPASDDSINGSPASYTDHATSGWEHEALPIGNGYLGAMVFGRTDRERIQLTDNTLFFPDTGLTNLAETYIYFDHGEDSVLNYYRDLSLDDAIAHVEYHCNGVTYTREYFASYTDRALVINLGADGTGCLNFSLSPKIPFLSSETCKENGTKGSKYARRGTVRANADGESNNITLSGIIEGHNVKYEVQYRIITDGTVSATRCDRAAIRGSDDDTCCNSLTVSDATYATVLISSGTNHQLVPQVYSTTVFEEKLKGLEDPHNKVTEALSKAANKTLCELKSNHINDYKAYFDRVSLNLGGEEPSVTTDLLLSKYNDKSATDKERRYLEELFFQYGRYLLIASSRNGGVPTNLNGIWNQYEKGVCGVGYYHNINVMMNYWLAFNTNLAETFLPYVNMYKAYLDHLHVKSDAMLKRYHPDKYDEGGDNGINIGCRVTPYKVEASDRDSSEGSACGPLMGEVFWDYYAFTKDKKILEEIVYPYVSETSKFMTKIMEEFEEYPGLLLAPVAGSPENHVPIVTNGAAFPQQMAYSSHLHTLEGAKDLGIEDDPLLETITYQMPRLDPVMVGHSGQMKEFREETFYGEFGEYKHRHISHLVALYPASFVNNSTPAWQDAAAVSLDKRGGTWARTGWGAAHRINAFARLGDGESAYGTLEVLFSWRVNRNLLDTHPPFQIDGNFGTSAGIAEMLLQSHEECIAPLAALPDAWRDGSYEGLVARGNFVVSASWANGNATSFTILSKSGGECSVKYANVGSAVLKDSKGNTVSYTKTGDDIITWDTEVGETYKITSIPTHSKIDAPTDLEVTYSEGGSLASLTWVGSDGAARYNVYRAVNSDATYTFIGSTEDTSYDIREQLYGTNQYTYCVTAVDADGTESRRLTYTVPRTDTPKSASGYFLNSTTLQLIIDPVATADIYEIYKVEEDGTLTLLKTTGYASCVITDADPRDKFVLMGVRSGLRSDICPIEIKTLKTEKEAVDNALLFKHVADSSPVATYYSTDMSPNKAFDGDLNTRASTKPRVGELVFTVDLGGRYCLDDLVINEHNTSSITYSPETTVEYSPDCGYTWVKVIDKQPLNTPTAENTETVFKDLGVELATNVRFTFNNNNVDNNNDPILSKRTVNVNEIEWSGIQLPDARVNKLEAQTVLEAADTIDPTGFNEESLTDFNNAKEDLKKLFELEFPDKKLLDSATDVLKHLIHNA